MSICAHRPTEVGDPTSCVMAGGCVCRNQVEVDMPTAEPTAPPAPTESEEATR